MKKSTPINVASIVRELEATIAGWDSDFSTFSVEALNAAKDLLRSTDGELSRERMLFFDLVLGSMYHTITKVQREQARKAHFSNIFNQIRQFVDDHKSPRVDLGQDELDQLYNVCGKLGEAAQQRVYRENVERLYRIRGIRTEAADQQSAKLRELNKRIAEAQSL